jgi:adenosylcobinamide-phosphate synthase
MEILIAVFIGFILDLVFGDPQWLPHPVRLIGFLIAKGEKIIRRILPVSKSGEMFGGIILAVTVITIAFTVPALLLHFAGKVSPILKISIHTVFCYQILATKSLRTESMRVYYQLINNDITNARKYLSWIVGRDTDKLTEEAIAKATVETIAENTSDGVIAPMIFIAIGGAPLGFLYKAVNTLDSMIGYKNEKYLYFGRFAAKLDDVFNFIPAIISAYIMMCASFFTGGTKGIILALIAQKLSLYVQEH